MGAPAGMLRTWAFRTLGVSLLCSVWCVSRLQLFACCRQIEFGRRRCRRSIGWLCCVSLCVGFVLRYAVSCCFVCAVLFALRMYQLRLPKAFCRLFVVGVHAEYSRCPCPALPTSLKDANRTNCAPLSYLYSTSGAWQTHLIGLF